MEAAINQKQRKSGGIKVIVSAPGKVILHGEHSVVYNKLAVASSIGLRTFLTLEEQTNEASNEKTFETSEENQQTTTDDNQETRENHEVTNGNQETRENNKATNENQEPTSEDQEAANERKIILDFQAIPLKATLKTKDLEKLYTSPSAPLLLDNIDFFILHEDSLKNLPKSSQNALKSFIFLYLSLLNKGSSKFQVLYVKAESQIRIASGLGSSASFNVVLAAAMLQYRKLAKINCNCESPSLSSSEKQKTEIKLGGFDAEELREISRWAFESERIMHGNPSGIDNSVCTYGSFVEFRRRRQQKHEEEGQQQHEEEGQQQHEEEGQQQQQGEEKEEAKPLNLHCKLSAMLIDTKVEKDTKAMVGKVAKLKEKWPVIVGQTFESMEIVAQNAVRCLMKLDELQGRSKLQVGSNVEGDVSEERRKVFEDLNDLIDFNQGLLRVLGVSHEKIEEICVTLGKHGLHGKITGAGGGGYVLCLIPSHFPEEEVKKVAEKLETMHFEVLRFDLGSNGVQLH